MTSIQEYSGIICPTVTPFTDGEVDEDAVGASVDFLVERGVTGLMPVGTTGEFASLTDDEYERVVETTIEAADGDAVVLPGCLDTSVPGTLEKVRTAERLGADAAVVSLPYFHTAKKREGNERFLRAIADGSPLPLVLYNQPRYTGQEIAVETVSALADHERVVGLKDSGGDLGYFMKVMRDTPGGFLTVQGFDNLLLPGTLLGSDGGVVALANALPGECVEVFEAARRGESETARVIHETQLLPLFDRCFDLGFATVSKAVLEMEGVIPSAEVRPPLVELTSEERGSVREVVPDL